MPKSSIHQNSSDSDTISDASLSPAQALVIAALARGCTVTAAALDAGLHRTTIHHWMRHEPGFEAAVQDAQREYSATLQDGMRDLACRAIETFGSLLEDPKTPAAIRLKTAMAILQAPDFPKPSPQLPSRIQWQSESPVEDLETDYNSSR